VVIIGGGAVGSAVAYFLANQIKQLKIEKSIIVIERDNTYRTGASARSAASIRHQFTNPENIKMSQFGTEFLRNIKDNLSIPNESPPDVNFHEGGYLFLSSPDGEKILRQNYQTQSSLGADVHLLPAKDLQRKFPWLSVDGISLGSFGASGEGWLDAYGLVIALKRKAQSLGVKYVNEEVTNLEKVGERISKVVLKGGDIEIGKSGVVVNTAGTRAWQILRMVGEDIPVRPKRRCIFVYDCPNANTNNLSKAPLTIDISGVYFRPEGKYFLAGVSPPEDNDPDVSPDDFEVDHSLWDDIIWPILASRVPQFEAVKVINSWAGHYDYNTFDQNAIIGSHPRVKNLFIGNGFSGHGLQQSLAVGRGLVKLC
jgi:glycine/D-amino acid oxidase-like deaminating enzyme